MNKNLLHGIDTVILRVSDVAKSKVWYTQKLGFRNIYEDSKTKLVVLDVFSPTSLTLWQTDEKIATNPKTSAYPIFRTQDANAAHLQLMQSGINVGDVTTDHVVSYFNFQDPD